MAEKLNVIMGNLKANPPVGVKAEGALIWDAEGKEYLDFCNAAVVTIGHGVKEIGEAVTKQMEKVSFVYKGTYVSQPSIDLANKVLEMCPELKDGKVFFCCGGSEAGESALKLARQYQIERGKPSKYKVIGRWQSYHGNTIATLSIGGRSSWRRVYDSYLLKMPHIANCNCYHCPFNAEYPSCGLICAEELERTILNEGPETVSAFILETIVAATAGAPVPPDDYFRKIKAICDKYDVLLICDEVITGLGRTGKNFAFQHFGIVPDLVMMAKGLGSGYVPIAGVICSKKVLDGINAGSGNIVHNFTYSGHAAACAGSCAVLDYLNKQKLVARSAEIGKYFLDKLKEELGQHPMVGDIRGLGMLIGVVLVKDKATHKSYPASLGLTGKVLGACKKRGLITNSALQGFADGVNGDAVMFTAPFIITKAQVDKAVAILKDAIEEVYAAIK